MEETIMSMKTNHQLPLPEVLKQEYPLSKELQKAKLLRDQEIRRIFTGESDKFVVLVALVPQTTKTRSANTSIVSKKSLTKYLTS